jgi:hypothetical protein
MHYARRQRSRCGGSGSCNRRDRRLIDVWSPAGLVHSPAGCTPDERSRAEGRLPLARGLQGQCATSTARSALPATSSRLFTRTSRVGQILPHHLANGDFPSFLTHWGAVRSVRTRFQKQGQVERRHGLGSRFSARLPRPLPLGQMSRGSLADLPASRSRISRSRAPEGRPTAYLLPPAPARWRA